MAAAHKPALDANYDANPWDLIGQPRGGLEGVAPSGNDEDHFPEIMERPGGALEARAATYWPEKDEDSPCYRHLAVSGGSAVQKEFSFNKAAFELLCAANRYVLKAKEGVVVIGLRGAGFPQKEAHENVQNLPLKLTRPNLYNFRCVLGYYFPGTGTFSGFTGSTVPWHEYIEAGKNANILPPGVYLYQKGPHPRSGTVNPAFRLPDSSPMVTVLRRSEDDIFDFNGEWDKNDDVWDNIHCAYYEDRFSSQGCQTVKGGTSSGLWARFQNTIKKLPSGAYVEYVLMTGDEASLAAEFAAAGKTIADPEVHQRLSRLRVGSQGPEVERLQTALNLPASTTFGPATKKKLTEVQAEKQLPADGIFSPAIEAAFGGGIFSAPAIAVGGMPAEQGATGGGADTSPIPRPQPQLQPQPQAQPQPQPRPQLQPQTRDNGGTVAVTSDNAPSNAQPSSNAQPLPSPPVAATDTEPKDKVVRTPATGLLTRELLSKVLPQTSDSEKQAIRKAYVDAITSDRGAAIFAKHGLAESKHSLAYAIANMCAETGGLTLIRESMVWKDATRLATLASADYTTDPNTGKRVKDISRTIGRARDLINRKDWEGIGEFLYGITAPRKKICADLGNTQPGDGFRFRGGGFLQTTGRSSYRELGERVGLGTQLEDNPNLIDDPYVSLEVACAEWKNKKLNSYAADGDFKACCRGINIGNPQSSAEPEGMEARSKYVRALCPLFGLPIPSKGALESVFGEDFEYGDIDPVIAVCQQQLDQLGYDVGSLDGDFTEQTRDSVLSFQATNGLPTTGKLDITTREALAAPAARAGWQRRRDRAEAEAATGSASALQPAAPTSKTPPPSRGGVIVTLLIALLGLSLTGASLALTSGLFVAPTQTQDLAAGAMLPMLVLGWLVAVIAAVQALRRRSRST